MRSRAICSHGGVPRRLLDEPIAHVQFLFLLVTTIFLVPFLTSDSTLDPVLAPRFLAWAILLLVLCISFLPQVLAGRGAVEFAVLRRGIFPAFLGYLLFSLASLSRAVNVAEGIYEVLKVFLSAVFLLAAVVILSRRSAYITLLAKAVVLLALVLSLIGFYQYFRHGAVEKPGYSLMTGTMGHKNLFASALFLMLPFCGYVVLTGRRGWRLAGGVVMAFMVMLIFLSETRAVWLALFTATVVTAVVAGALVRSSRLEIPRETRRQSVRIACLVVVVLLLLGLPVGLCYLWTHSAGDMVDAALSRESLAQRISTWRHTCDIIRGAPILGIGPGNWKIVFPSHRVLTGLPPEWLRMIFFVRPHNDFLWVLSEVGAVGFVFYLLTFLIPIIWILRMVLQRPDTDDAWLLLSMLYGIVGYMVVAFFCFPRERVFHTLFLLLMMAVVTCVYHRRFPPVVQPRRLPLVGLLLLTHALLLFAVAVGYSRLTAEIHTRRAFAARSAQDWPAVIAEIDKGRSVFATVDPMSTPLAWYRGEANFMCGRVSQARADYTEALRVNPYHVLVLSNLATCYELEGRHQEAIHYYEEALAIHPQFNEALANLVAVRFNAGQYEQARAILLRYDPETRNPTLERYLRILDAQLERRDDIMPEAVTKQDGSQKGGVVEPLPRGAKGVHQLWSSTYGRCFYTIDDGERDAFVGRGGGLWTYEGIAYEAFTAPARPGLCPVHRFYAPDLKAYFYTIVRAEADRLLQDSAPQWQYEGTAFYAYPEGRQPPEAAPVHRFWSGSLRYHYFTADENEKDKLRTAYARTWTYEGVAWYAHATRPAAEVRSPRH